MMIQNITVKKYFYSILAFSIVGAVVSGILFVQHYLPNANFGILSCTDNAISSCASVSQSQYSVFFGVPVAAFGLLFYLFFIFFTLICDYAGDIYIRIFAVLGLMAGTLGLIGDLILAAILVYMKMFCHLCFTTYVVNIIIFALLLVFYFKYKSSVNFNIINIIKDFKLDSADRKAALSLFILFIFLLCFSVLQLNETLKANYGSHVVTQKQIDEYVKKFNDTPVENLVLPESRIVFGSPNAKLTITVFTDFLCSACYNFFKTEERILKKYYDKVKFVYYHYPFDMSCNKYSSRTVYQNSCIASYQIEAAANLNILSDYLDVHFSKYNDYSDSYNQEWADKILTETAKKINWHEDNINFFNKFVDSVKDIKTVENNIEFAAIYKINATPTLFISGKRILGGPKYQMLEAIIIQELEKMGGK